MNTILTRTNSIMHTTARRGFSSRDVVGYAGGKHGFYDLHDSTSVEPYALHGQLLGVNWRLEGTVLKLPEQLLLDLVLPQYGTGRGGGRAAIHCGRRKTPPADQSHSPSRQGLPRRRQKIAKT